MDRLKAAVSEVLAQVRAGRIPPCQALAKEVEQLDARDPVFLRRAAVTLYNESIKLHSANREIAGDPNFVSLRLLCARMHQQTIPDLSELADPEEGLTLTRFLARAGHGFGRIGMVAEGLALLKEAKQALALTRKAFDRSGLPEDADTPLARDVRDLAFALLVWEAEVVYRNSPSDALPLLTKASELAARHPTEAKYLLAIAENAGRAAGRENNWSLAVDFFTAGVAASDGLAGSDESSEHAATKAHFLRLLAGSLAELGESKRALVALDAISQLPGAADASSFEDAFLRVKAHFRAHPEDFDAEAARRELAALCGDTRTPASICAAACEEALAVMRPALCEQGLEEMLRAHPMATESGPVWGRLVAAYLASNRSEEEALRVLRRVGQLKRTGELLVEDGPCSSLFALSWDRAAVALEDSAQDDAKRRRILQWLDCALLFLPKTQEFNAEHDGPESRIERQRARLFLELPDMVDQAEEAIAQARAVSLRAATKANGGIAPPVATVRGADPSMVDQAVGSVHYWTVFVEFRIAIRRNDAPRAVFKAREMVYSPGFDPAALAVAAQVAFKAGRKDVAAEVLELLASTATSTPLPLALVRSLVMLLVSSTRAATQTHFASLARYLELALSSLVSPRQPDAPGPAGDTEGAAAIVSQEPRPEEEPSAAVLAAGAEESDAEFFARVAYNAGHDAGRAEFVSDAGRLFLLSARLGAVSPGTLVPIRSALVLSGSAFLEAVRADSSNGEFQDGVKTALAEMRLLVGKELAQLGLSLGAAPAFIPPHPSFQEIAPLASALTLLTLAAGEAAATASTPEAEALAREVAAAQAFPEQFAPVAGAVGPEELKLSISTHKARLLAMLSGVMASKSRSVAAKVCCEACVSELEAIFAGDDCFRPPDALGMSVAGFTSLLRCAAEACRLFIRLSSDAAERQRVGRLVVRLAGAYAGAEGPQFPADEVRWVLCHFWNEGVRAHRSNSPRDAEAFLSLAMSALPVLAAEDRAELAPTLRAAYGLVLERCTAE
eukprot:gnl/Chilomastix_cuspidata/2358.p1 GENE.gnl/Chilomastix_cuspidata/2358~~gnl/Chilomastix_cuspidata/2358.p1  ORF type:complete len:1016 (-),score=517.18 gnl/Chilomastix_cuspidata/2358:1155-4202(-)